MDLYCVYYTNMKQTISKIETKEKKNRREGRGRVISLSRHVYRLQGKDTYYVESESCDSRYYFVRYEPSSFEWCSCFDNSTRGEKCKHIWAIEYAIRFNTIKEVPKLPKDVLVKKDIVIATTESTTIVKTPKSWEDDEYNF